MTETGLAPKKLAGFEAIGKAFRFVFGNLRHLFATAALTLSVILVFQVWYMSVTIDQTVELTKAYLSDDAGAMIAATLAFYFSPQTITLVLISMAISLVFGGMFAIRWHRSALFGSNADSTGFGFEFSASLRRYVVYGLGIGVIYVAILAIPAAIAGIGVRSLNVGLSALGGTLLFFGSIAAPYVCGRLSLALPAAALDIPNFGLGAAWRYSDGYGWGIFWAVVVMAIAAVAVSALIAIPISLVMGLVNPLPIQPFTDDLDVLIAWQSEVIRAQSWTQIIPNIFIYPILTGLFTSLFSYIYLQIGKPPAWVEEQRAN